MFGNKTDSSFSFSSLAAKSPGDGGFGFGKKQGDGLFNWQGAGSTLFKSAGQPAAASGEGDEGEDGEVEQGPDVHFEPIVQLPEVEVKTGKIISIVDKLV